MVVGLIQKLLQGRGPALDLYAELDIPGTAQLDLPAGPAFCTFQVARRSAISGESTLEIPENLLVSLTADGGEELPFNEEQRRVRMTTMRPPLSRRGCGHWVVPSAGRYTLEAKPALEDRTDPKLLVSSRYPGA